MRPLYTEHFPWFRSSAGVSPCVPPSRKPQCHRNSLVLCVLGMFAQLMWNVALRSWHLILLGLLLSFCWHVPNLVHSLVWHSQQTRFPASSVLFASSLERPLHILLRRKLAPPSLHVRCVFWSISSHHVHLGVGPGFCSTSFAHFRLSREARASASQVWKNPTLFLRSIQIGFRRIGSVVALFVGRFCPLPHTA